MAIQGIQMLPPEVKMEDALVLYKEIAEIKTLIGKLNSELNHSIINSQLIQILSLQESVQSTRIEGTQVTFADMIEDATKKRKSSEVVEVDNYLAALKEGIELTNQGYPISTRLIKQLHEILMGENTRGTTISAGEFRKIQNFIGPTDRIEDAVYIPIPASDISDYMSNLENYVNGQEHYTFNTSNQENHILLDIDSDPLIKTAIMHAQFESIHPFLDGHGRMGRILIVLNTMSDNLIEYPVFFVSEELEKERLRYYNLLNGVRGNNPDWYAWIKFFLDACKRMATSILNKLESIEQLARKGLRLINSTGSINKSWLYSFTKTSVSTREVADFLNISPTTARHGLNHLVDLKLLDTDKAKTKNKVYVNYDLLRLLG